MSELQALRKARNMTALMRHRYFVQMEKFEECPVRTMFAGLVIECDECLSHLDGMIEVRAPGTSKDWDMSESVTPA